MSEPCQNGGTCNDSANGYMCLCAHGYRGDSCKGKIIANILKKRNVHVMLNTTRGVSSYGGGGYEGYSYPPSLFARVYTLIRFLLP